MRVGRQACHEVQGNVKSKVSQDDRSGKIAVELIDVIKRYGDRTAIDNFTATVVRGDEIDILGANSVGKTTLLKLILSELAPDSDTVHNGTNLQVTYFDQMRVQPDLNRSLADIISSGSDWIKVNGQHKHMMSHLDDFLFPLECVRLPMASLSGDEHNRSLLACLPARPTNVLVPDEPTNNLDINMPELLEEPLQEYSGMVFLVSRDRVFVDNVATSMIVAEGEGR